MLTVAWYTMPLDKQFPRSGHSSGCLQLHRLLLGSLVQLASLRVRVLCCLRICADVFHAAITYLYRVSVEYFVQFAVFREMGVDELEEFPSYVCCYAPVEWWIEPHNPPRLCPSLAFVQCRWLWCLVVRIHEPFRVSACF